ncbi:intradiol ring-cleavage dioxygenase [Demequina mangrovi]|uniref:Protocatechuate 3,4-dioxygenase beta subunit n=1 Tax=Demequina mangrovi TaxID=1043493 RepID=A0A1H7AYU6_9MICO|nr:intradiol ring-cleavage dioxygenase [Demequina mangrovi]SEJ70749.1 Protocatechuate 3,4-dioxygenase beta subunit [Demequina mangrovi]
MARIPEPVPTPEGPAYEGRLLDRPDEEVVDQGVAFDLRTLVSRRGIVGMFGLGAGAAVLAACSPSASSSAASATASSLTEIPDETAGPYPGDGSNGPDVLEESGIVRRDIRSSIGADDPVPGVPLDFTFTVLDMANGGVPMAGAAVYAWHCDAAGRYSMYSDGVTDETWLRGVQVTDDDGEVTFTSVMPGCYTGRWTHIHFEVYPSVDDIEDSSKAIATSQMAFPQNVLDPVYELSDYDGSAANLAQLSLATDNVFGDDGGVHQMGALKGGVDAGYTATLTVPIDTTTAPTAGTMAGGGGGGGGDRPEGGPGGGEPPSAPPS